MHRKYSRSILAALAVAAISADAVEKSTTKADTVNRALPPAGLDHAVKWPSVVPCRVNHDVNDRIWLMTLGDVKTPLAEGTFDPVADKVTLNDGTVIENYYKEKLGFPYYQAMDKTRYPIAPSGWCSWYYYYATLQPNEVQANAKLISDKLFSWGATVCQIDDAWQDQKCNRDWTTVDPSWREPGMGALAKDIKDKGLTPGLWLAPHGQSNEKFVKESGLFLTDKDGKSLSDTWEGKYLLDATKPGAMDYLSGLFSKFHNEWGYDYFKIDGQPIVVAEYNKKKHLMANPPEDGTELYRDTLRTIRKAITADSFLLGCWGAPLLPESMGIVNGCRTGGDVTYSWPGFFIALDATVEFYCLHNIAWYCDPDVCYVRPPMSKDMVRAWLTLQGLTGQATLTSDRLPDVPADRLAMLRQVIPAADIRPMDLYKCGREKTVWDLKVNHLDRQYDVVGLFNWDDLDGRDDLLLWEDLGYKKTDRFHVYDFWNKEYLGVFDYGLIIRIPPSGARVLTLVPEKKHPQLVSTSRHMTQGWVDLVDYKESPETLTVSGTSRIPGDEPYTLTFAAPGGDKTYQLKDFTINKTDTKILKKITHSAQGSGTATVWVDTDGEFSWIATFEPETDILGMELGKLGAISAAYSRDRKELDITLGHGYKSQHWYLLKIDGKPLAYISHWDAVIPFKLRGGAICNQKLTAHTINIEGKEARKPVECTIMTKY